MQLICVSFSGAEYDDMSKKQLLGAISKLEKKLDKADADSMSLLSEMDNRHSDVQGRARRHFLISCHIPYYNDPSI